MITVHPYTSLGHANHGWLDARHHFSFGQYHNPERMQFGTLRVVNDDRIQAGGGFDMHPHRNMEIITFVRSGAITHRDSHGNEGRTVAGDVQVMSAGSGIFHSEYNQENEETTLYQIWITPNQSGVAPRWDSASFKQNVTTEALPLLVSGFAEDADKGALFIHQYAAIYGGRMVAGQSVTQNLRGLGYVLVSSGAVEINGVAAVKGDGVAVQDISNVTITAIDDAEVILIDAPAH